MMISSLEEGSFNWTFVIIFLLSLVLFVWRSLTVVHPFLDIRILKNPVILLGIIPFFLYQFSNLSANFLIPNFLVLVKHEATSAAGFALLPGTMLGAFRHLSLENYMTPRDPNFLYMVGISSFS